MEESKHNWITIHDTAGKTMTHVMSATTTVHVDWKNGFITKTIRGEEVDRIGFGKNFSLLAFLTYLEKTEQETNSIV